MWADGRPFVREIPADGEGESVSTALTAPLVQITEDPRGVTFALDARGAVRVREARGWVDVVRESGSEPPSMVAHPAGGVWVVAADQLIRVAPSLRVTRAPLAEVGTIFGIDGEAPLLVTIDAGRGFDDAVGQPWSHVAWDGARTWVSDGVRTWPLGEPSFVPSPGALSVVVAAPGSPLYAVDAAGGVVMLVDGPGPALSDATETWGAMQVGDVAAVVADTDGDGLEDLISLSDRGRIRLFLQRDGALVDGSRALVDVSERVTAITACDLDKNGRADLVFSETDAAGDTHLRYLRSTGGAFVDATERSGLAESRFGPTVPGALQCVDLDGDGALDLVVLPGDTPLAPRVWRNTGWGRLWEVPLAVRGLGARDGHARALVAPDLDEDGANDVILGGGGASPRVLLSDAGGRPVDKTVRSGLAGQLAPRDLWWGPLPGGVEGLLALDPAVGPRMWRRGETLMFDEVTREVGLDVLPQLSSDTGPISWLVADIDSDDRADVAVCHPTQGCSLLIAGERGFDVVDGALPRALTDVRAIVTIDLGGDGVRDLLLVRPGQDALFENHAPPVVVGQASEPPAQSSVVAIKRGLAWARPWPDGALAALSLLPALIAHVLLQLEGAAIMLGRRLGALAVGVVMAGAWLVLVESPLGDRAAFAGTSAAVVLLATFAEFRYDRHRRAKRVAGYRLGAKIGQGGMGTVYVATHEGTGQTVALKIVHPDMLARAEDRQSYAREAQIGANLRDPRIVRIFETGETTLFDGQPQRTAYLVMELLNGQTLRAYLNHHGTLGFQPACTILHEVALALQTLHEAGIVHRDVKPDNIMILPDGSVKLMDLGAARQAGHVTKSKRQVLGTLGYLAPEQGRGRAPDPRSDIYACGIVLYEMLAGHRPFEADDLVALLQMVLQSPPPRLERRDVPLDVQRVIEKALAKDPDHRYGSAKALAAAVAPWNTRLEIVDEIQPDAEEPAPFALRGQPVSPWFLLLIYVRAMRAARGRPALGHIIEALARYGWHTVERPEHRRALAEGMAAWSARFRAERPAEGSVSTGFRAADSAPGERVGGTAP